MMKSGTFSKRSVAATKGFESHELWFQVAFSFVFAGTVCVYGKNNLNVLLARYISLEFSYGQES